MARLIAAEELWEAWERVESNEGCAGCDAVRVDQFVHRAAREIESLAHQAANGTYKAFPLLRIVVEKKAGTGKTRTLLVPTVRDRVIQTAIARQLSRSFEQEFLECSYG
ncbi:MAG: hypothetical protein IT168_00265 [Bryobacterales bacterium]|nr:hypothetical protein [Bryobacterales bacterium]